MTHAVVVGAGIGGLTAALCLARAGIRVFLVEQAEALGEVGAGIQLTPNAMRVLAWLGLGTRLEAFGSRPESAETRDYRSGRTITANPIEQGDEPTYLTLHRADLIEVLSCAAAGETLIDLRLADAVAEVQIDLSPSVVTRSGRQIDADVVIGADGIHSVVRESLFGPDQARYTGHVAWRGLVDVRALRSVAAPRVVAWWGPRRHFVHYPVRGGRLVNCVGVVEESSWQAESWVERGEKEVLVEEFRDWHPLVVELVREMDPVSCFKWGLFDRAPPARWSNRAVTLLGDACHPTLPFLAQGGALAIEDAMVLAGCLAAHDVQGALLAYERRRRPRAKRLQAAAKRNGMIFHLGGLAARARNWVAQPASRRVLRSVFEYDAVAEGGLFEHG